MTVTTVDKIAGPATEKAQEPGLFSRIIKAVAESREREARRYVQSYLRSLDDETLAELGYGRAEIGRSGGGLAFRF